MPIYKGLTKVNTINDGTNPITVVNSGIDRVYSKIQIPRNGLVSEYLFNGNANDTGSYGIDGIVDGAVLTSDRYENPNSAYLFDGNDRINIDPAYSELNASSVMSFSFWINTTTGRFSFGNLKSNGRGWELKIGSTEIRFSAFALIGGSLGNIIGDGIYSPDGVWKHCFIEFNGFENYRFYINNEILNMTSSIVNGSGYDPNLGVGLGFTWVTWFTGKLDSFRAYDRVLSSDERKSLYDE